MINDADKIFFSTDGFAFSQEEHGVLTQVGEITHHPHDVRLLNIDLEFIFSLIYMILYRLNW